MYCSGIRRSLTALECWASGATCGKKLRSILPINAFLRLDIVVPLSLNSYNSIVDHNLRILDDFHSNSLLLMIGNTKNIWKPFVDFYDKDNIPSNPLNNYCEIKIKQLLEEFQIKFSSSKISTKVFWAYETSPGKCIAIQRMSAVAGVGYLCPISNLCIHPVYGPWYAFRCVIGFNIPCDINKSAIMKCPYNTEVEAHIKEAINIALNTKNWKDWLNVRISICNNHPYMYENDQIKYHYNYAAKEVRDMILKQIIIKNKLVKG